jgi:hypothetical protein
MGAKHSNDLPWTALLFANWCNTRIVFDSGLAMVTVYRSAKHTLVRLLAAITIPVCIWHLIVHRTYSPFKCKTCQLSVMKYTDWEILKFPLVTHVELSSTLIGRIAEDFQCPCPHDEWYYAKADYWGRYYSLDDLQGSFVTAPSPEWDRWYEKVVRPQVMQFKKDHPDIAEEFCRRVIKEGDIDYYYNSFYEEVMKGMLQIPDFE